MTSHAKLETRGVALLATRMSVLGEDPCGGSEVVMWEDVAILRDAGIPVRVYGRAAREGAPVRVLPLRTSAPLVTSIEYGGRFLRKEPEALIIAYNEPALAGWAPKRTIVRFDWSTALPRYWNWPFWRSRFQRARYLFPSESERQLFLRQHDQIHTQGTTVVPNAVDLRLFRPLNGGPSNQPARTLRVGFAGQWVPRKGIGELLKAWLIVKSTLPSAELDMAGGAHMWKNVRETAGSRESTDRVREMNEQGLLRCAGALPRARMPEFWNSVDVAVVPSLYEPFGLVALEAMACGVPVVATAVGGLKEIVQDGESGLLVPPGDAGSLAQGLTTLLTDKPLRRRLATGARCRAEKFSIERRSHELLQLLSERTGGGSVSAKERILHSVTRSAFVRGTYGALRGIPVVGAGVRKLVHAAMPLGTKLWIQIPNGLGKGLWIYADPRSELGYTNGDHEPWIQDILKTELRPGDCYYDVGAHAGFFCLIASRFVGPSGKVAAFEPDPENAAALKANIAKNGLAQVSVVEAAAWSSPGYVTFERASDASNRTQGHVVAAKDVGIGRISVPAVRLDDLVFSDGHEAPCLIKMDVEGAEWEALQGARRLFTEVQPKLLCEVHDAAQMGQIRAYLEGFGYTAEEWKPVHPRYSDYHQLYLWALVTK